MKAMKMMSCSKVEHTNLGLQNKTFNGDMNSFAPGQVLRLKPAQITILGHTKRVKRGKRDSSKLSRALMSDEVSEISAGLPSFRSILDLMFVVGILGSLTWSALPVIASSTEARKNSWQEKVWAKQEEQGIKWGVMSVISFLPVFNWLAWIFAALQDEERAAFYYALAVLYAGPQIEAGFQPDLLSIVTLVAGIAHVQVERIAEEREVQRETFQLSNSVREKPREASKLIGDSAKSFAEAVDLREQNQDIKGEVLRGKTSKRSQREGQEDLRSWDERLKNRK